MEKLLTYAEAAEILGVAKTSIRNWVRHGLLQVKGNGFSKSEVEELKRKIESNEIDRLKKRANKLTSKKKFLPDEYLSLKKTREDILLLVGYITDNNIETEKAIFLLALNLFIQSQEIKETDIQNILDLKRSNFRRGSVYQHLKEWFSSFLPNSIGYQDESVKYLLEYSLSNERDILGVIYQSILLEGKKSKLGSYYTPLKIVKALVADSLKKDALALDPCCGTGQFLLVFSDTIDNPENIFGFDIDALAVKIAKTNLFLKYPNIDFNPNIYTLNSLLIKTDSNEIFLENIFKKKFNLIATNPPWGAVYKEDTSVQMKNNFKEIDTRESFCLFICLAYRLIEKDGIISFVLPESITNVKAHKQIREFIQQRLYIEKIQIMGKCFKNVLSPVILLTMRKDDKNNKNVEIIHNNKQYSIDQNRFNKNKNYFFDIYVNNSDLHIFSKIKALQHTTLENNSEWALGIVTGDNGKYLKKGQHFNSEPVFKGVDVDRFRLRPPTSYIEFTPEKFQQVANEEKYRVEKLIYRFISNNLIFAYDNKKSLTLNSANILIPKIEGISIKQVAGFLNSNLYNYYFKKKFNSLKILKDNIQQLPIPILENQQKKELENLVDKIINENKSLDNLNSFVYRIFKITKAEIAYIENYIGIA